MVSTHRTGRPVRRPASRVRSAARRTRAVTGIGVVVIALVSACGGGGGDLSTGDVAAPSGGSAAGLRTLRVAETAGTPTAFLAYGVQRGYFAQEKLDLKLQPSTGGATVIPALMNGDIDVAGSNVVSAMIAMDRGLDLRMIAAGTSTAEDPERDFSAILVAKDSRITDVAGLAGAEVAVNTLQNINDVVIYGMLDKQGVDRASVRFIEMPFPDMVPAIQRGDVDAGLVIEPFVAIGRSQGLRAVARPYADLRPGLQIGTFLMTTARTREDPQLVASFQAGVQRTADSIRTDPTSFRQALPKIANIDPALVDDVNLSQWKGRTDRPSIELIASLMRRYELMKGEFDYAAVVLR
jgi:NitT/TauT family transport system substrate-binding protein